MRILDALKTILPSGGKDETQYYELSTTWGRNLSEADPPLAEYPRPQLRRNGWICLNGKWAYAFTDTKDRPERPDGTILVPFSPESTRSGVGRTLLPGQYLWYYRAVHLCHLVDGQRLLLHFGAVDERCTLWWNGKMVGSHRGGYLPFTFDITPYVREGANSLWLRVQDDTNAGWHSYGKQSLNRGGMFYTPQSGIWQTVWMEWVPESRIESVRYTPLFDEQAIRIEVTVTRPQRVEIHFPQNGTGICSCLLARDFAPDSDTGLYNASRSIPLSDFHPWSPEDPWLYPVWISTRYDLVRSYFAMRKFSTGIDAQGMPRLMLNNRPYFFHGILDQGYWPDTLYTPPGDAAIVYDLNMAKRHGFNTIRKHLKVEPLRWYYHCDRLGLVVWQDMVNGGRKPFLPLVCYLPTALPAVQTLLKDSHLSLLGRASIRGREEWLHQMEETVTHLYNCPSLGLWTLFNEGWGQFGAAAAVERMRELDATRPLDHASGWFDQGCGDVKSVHNYFRSLKVPKKAYRSGRETRPFVLSEYGGLACAVNGHLFCSKSYGYRTFKTPEAFRKRFFKLMDEIRALEKDGLSGAVYTQLSDIEEEINGLVTYDRKYDKLD